jgi:hypothetical protein
MQKRLLFSVLADVVVLAVGVGGIGVVVEVVVTEIAAELQTRLLFTAGFLLDSEGKKKHLYMQKAIL